MEKSGDVQDGEEDERGEDDRAETEPPTLSGFERFLGDRTRLLVVIPRKPGFQVLAPTYAMRSIDDVGKDTSGSRVVALGLPLSLKHSVYYNQDRKAYKPHIDDPRRKFYGAHSHVPMLVKNDNEPYTQSYETSQKK
ncbi:hypothetical protein BU15DRAFT_79446 [Melanogaster broomeanus]|nr:hypothetical protein BU15DRAFT_79446 [Melanogaster broomeanus]